MKSQWESNFILFAYPVEGVYSPGDSLTILFDFDKCRLIQSISETMDGVMEYLEIMDGVEIRVEFVQLSRLDPTEAILRPQMRDIKLKKILWD